MGNLKEVTDSDFTDIVIASEKPVLVDFWAEWCRPCHIVAPEVEAIAQSHAEKLEVVKLNIDENPSTAGQYGVMSIPTLLLFVDGVEKARLVGARPRDAILSEIQSFLG